MNLPNAEIVALKGLAFLVNDDEALERFLNLTGITGPELREQAGELEFLAALLDFLMGDEPLLTRFCETEGLDAQTLHGARRALPGA